MSLSVALRHRFAGFELDIAFEAPPGVTALFGRSGSGKTTIVNAVAGLLRPQSGRIAAGRHVLLDTDRRIVLPPHRRAIGYIFQESRLFPHLSVQQNLDYGKWFAGKRTPALSADRVVEMLGIGHLLQRRPAALSGGEKQRVAIGRALLASPSLILADEPLASLDEARKAEIMPYFERLRDETAVPILYVSHSASEVARLATTVVALREGKVSAQGPAGEILADPSVTPLGIRDVGAVLTTTLLRHHGDGLSELDAGGQSLFLPHVDEAPGTSLRLRIAAHDVILSRARPEGLSALNIVAGRIVDIRHGEGPGALIVLEVAAGRLLARITARSVERLDLRAGMACHAIIKSVAVDPRDVSAAP